MLFIAKAGTVCYHYTSFEYSCTLASLQYAPPAWHLRIYPTWTFVSTGYVAQNPQLHRVPTFATCLAAPACSLLACVVASRQLVLNSAAELSAFSLNFSTSMPLVTDPSSFGTNLHRRLQRASQFFAPAQLTCHFKEQFADSSNATRRAKTTRRDRVFAHPVVF